jgi:hypothetical protein
MQSPPRIMLTAPVSGIQYEESRARFVVAWDQVRVPQSYFERRIPSMQK